ncbi:protein of unknown function [Limnospira indica PCC 8005]|uniref:Uncharacterized protein n=1 Tax=Limnospira indica PCC 8005 TaxID=376219 RepID=A0A9P1KCR2_9CYAN|nr:protein of unknown function [Limnospira indica PCC 8005]
MKERKRLRREAMRMMIAAPEHCFWKGEPPQYRDDLIYIEATAAAWDWIISIAKFMEMSGVAKFMTPILTTLLVPSLSGIFAANGHIKTS